MELIATIAGAFSTTAASTTAATAGATAAGTTSAALLAAPVSSAAGFSAAAAGGGLSLSTALNGLTMASSALSLFSGNSQADAIIANAEAQTRSLTLSAEDEKLAMRQEELAAKSASNETLNRLNRTLAAQRLAFSANGVDGDFGSSGAIAESAFDEAGQDIAFSRADANLRILQRRRQMSEILRERGYVQSNAESSALSARQGGALSAVGTAAGTLERMVNRG